VTPRAPPHKSLPQLQTDFRRFALKGGARTAQVQERKQRQLKFFRRRGSRASFWLRFAVASPLFALAVFFAIRSWNPLGNGYFSGYKDSPDRLYLTVAAIGVAIAAMFAATGLLVAWRGFRTYGGFVLLAAAAVAASVLPYVLFKWTSEPETWPWAFFVQDWIGWLHFAPRSRAVGITIQIGLAVIVAAAVVAQLLTWLNPSRLRGAETGGGLIDSSRAAHHQ